jgi:tetratricopeptide (TPR) repeat protein
MAEENTPESGASSPDPELGASEPVVASEDGARSAVSESGAVSPAAVPSAAATPSPATTVATQTSVVGKGVALTPGQRLAAKKAQKAVEKREFKEEIKVREEEKRQKEEAEADRLLGRAPPQPALPAEVEQAARTFSDFMQDHRDKILMTLGALAALAAIAFGAQRFLRSGAAEHAAQLGRALEIANAAIDADDADGKADDGKPVFKTEQDRATKALAAFDEVIKGGGDDDAATWAKLGAAAQQVALGKFDEAQKRFQGVYDEHTKQPQIAARALEGVGIALEGAGKQDEAR